MPVDFTPTPAMALNAVFAAGPIGESLEDTTKECARKIASQTTLSEDEFGRICQFFAEPIERAPGWGQTISYAQFMAFGGDHGKAWAQEKKKELQLSLSEETHVFAEMFLADSTVKTDKNGLIWKPMIHEGVWAVGPDGKPLKVTAGRSANPLDVIGLQDVVDNFYDGAVQHVTIPKTHDDKVDENTGYVKHLKIENHNGIPTLWGGHDFTEPEIKAKVERGSIANTSCGFEFGYTRKQDGKRYPIVLRHNALTNRPFLGQLAPFGLSESDGKFDIYSMQFAEPLEVASPPTPILDGSNPTPPLEEIVPDPVIPAGDVVVTPPVATPVAPAAPEYKLSEDPQFIAVQAENARLKAQADQMYAEARERSTNDFIDEVKALGFSETNAMPFLKKLRTILSQDTGENAINLSEEGKTEQTGFTASALVKDLIHSLKDETTGKLVIQLSEQQSDPLHLSGDQRPPVGTEVLTLEDRQAAADKWFAENYGNAGVGVPAPVKE